MTNATWDEGKTPPRYERGLPQEIHFWKSGGEIYLLRDVDDDLPTWCRWNKGVAIKDVGLEYVTAAGRGEVEQCG